MSTHVAYSGGRRRALIEPPGALAKALVATLAVAPRDVGGTVGVDTIIDALGEAPPRNAKAVLPADPGRPGQ